MELRLFKLLCVVATLLVFLVILPVNYLLHLSPGISLAVGFLGLSTIFFFLEARRGRYHVASFFLLLMLNLNLTWFANGGSQESIIFYFFAAFVYVLVFFRGGLRWLLLSLAIANGAGLLAVEPYFLQWIVPYASTEHRLADLITSLVVTAVSSSLMLWSVLSSYDREQRRLTSLNAELERVADENRKLNEDLDLRVRERTARLESAMQEQESFCYSVSHDLRAPLRHINSYGAILEEECGGCLTGEARAYLERIRASSATMGILIDDLLELSRIGRFKLLKKNVHLSECAGAIARRLQESEPGRSAEFVIAPRLMVDGDRILLVQLLENLLGNAWKYTGRLEHSRIELGTSSSGDREVFFVKDNGVGFDMAYKDKLFGAFQRLHGSEFEGTGIGLATVKRIVERHGGTVWAEAAVNEGATVYFTLAGGAQSPLQLAMADPGGGARPTRRCCPPLALGPEFYARDGGAARGGAFPAADL